MREIHSHVNADEWQYYISGKGQMTVFAADARARTFDFLAGDVGYVPMSMSHFIEKIGRKPLRFFPTIQVIALHGVSLTQWIALTPHELVEAHLHIEPRILEYSSQGQVTRRLIHEFAAQLQTLEAYAGNSLAQLAWLPKSAPRRGLAYFAL